MIEFGGWGAPAWSGGPADQKDCLSPNFSVFRSGGLVLPATSVLLYACYSFVQKSSFSACPYFPTFAFCYFVMAENATLLAEEFGPSLGRVTTSNPALNQIVVSDQNPQPDRSLAVAHVLANPGLYAAGALITGATRVGSGLSTLAGQIFGTAVNRALFPAVHPPPNTVTVNIDRGVALDRSMPIGRSSRALRLQRLREVNSDVVARPLSDRMLLSPIYRSRRYLGAGKYLEDDVPRRNAAARILQRAYRSYRSRRATAASRSTSASRATGAGGGVRYFRRRSAALASSGSGSVPGQPVVRFQRGYKPFYSHETVRAVGSARREMIVDLPVSDTLPHGANFVYNVYQGGGRSLRVTIGDRVNQLSIIDLTGLIPPGDDYGRHGSLMQLRSLSFHHHLQFKSGSSTFTSISFPYRVVVLSAHDWTRDHTVGLFPKDATRFLDVGDLGSASVVQRNLFMASYRDANVDRSSVSYSPFSASTVHFDKVYPNACVTPVTDSVRIEDPVSLNFSSVVSFPDPIVDSGNPFGFTPAIRNGLFFFVFWPRKPVDYEASYDVFFRFRLSFVNIN